MAENYFGITHTGRIRDNNEDTFLAETLSNGWIVASVIDGVGGYEGGEVAAEIARETILKKLQQLSADPLQTLKESVLQANQNIYQGKLNNKGNHQMACVLTLALIDLESNQFYYAHVGDTRLYLLRDQSLVKVTKDHSFVGFLEDSGRLSEKEAMSHPKRNEINKALGFDPQIDLRSDYIETGQSPFLPGDILLLCSDGLTDLVNRSEMTTILLSSKPLKEKGQALIDAANNAGGKDNVTAVIVHNNKKSIKLKATKPITPKKNANKEEVSTITTTEKTDAPQQQIVVKKNNAAAWFFGLLCLLLAGACFWLWSNKAPVEKPPVVPTEHHLNEAEKKLQDSLGLANNTLLLSESIYGKEITLSDTLFIRQDTLHINGNGMVLRADSIFAGPAILTTANNKFLSLENITFVNFSNVLLWQGKAVQLVNVRFQNCKVPVQHQWYLQSDSAVNGLLRDTLINSKNSLPK